LPFTFIQQIINSIITNEAYQVDKCYFILKANMQPTCQQHLKMWPAEIEVWLALIWSNGGSQ